SIRRCNRVYEQRLFIRVHLPGLGKRGMQREEGAELRPRGEVLREIAAQPRISRVSGRRDDMQPVRRAALDNEDKAAVGRCPSECHLWECKASERSGGASCGNEGPAGQHGHLLTNSGLTSSSARPSAGLSALAIDVRVV